MKIEKAGVGGGPQITKDYTNERFHKSSVQRHSYLPYIAFDSPPVMQFSSEHDIQDCQIAVFVIHAWVRACCLKQSRGDVVYINDVG